MSRLFYLLILIGTNSMMAQTHEIVTDYTSKKLYKLGRYALDSKDYFLANTYFEALKGKGFETDAQKYDYAILLYQLHHYTESLDILTQLELNHYPDPLLYYYKAVLFYSVDQAIKGKDYISFFLKSKSNRELYKAQTSHLLTLKNYQSKDSLPQDSIYAYVTHLDHSVNKPSAEFNPLISNNKFWFGSQIMDQVNYYDQKKYLKGQVNSTRKIFTATADGPIITDITPFPVSFESIEISSFSLDLYGRVLYLTGCSFDEKKKKYLCSIYRSKKIDSIWSVPELVPELNVEDYTTTQVSIGYDDVKKSQILFFSSDRPGTRGGLDLWISYFNTKTQHFFPPKNLGSKINTLNEDITPFFHTASQRLYFSTNGRGGAGGQDVFYSTLKESMFSPIEHLGAQINSPQDDVFFSPNKTLENGYFVSNRYSENSLLNPHCCDDIFYYDRNAPKVPTSKIMIQVVNKGLVPILNFNYNLSKIDTSKLIFIENGHGIRTGTIYDLARKTDYEVEIYAKGYFRKKTLVEVKEDSVYYIKIVLDSIDYQPIVLPLVEFDFDSFTLTSDARHIIDSMVLPVLVANPTLKIELGAHTDSRGDDIYNEQLSWKRAKSIWFYLINHHYIDSKRLSYKGYGEYVPIAPNEYDDGSDNPTGRQRNRRCEFKILPEEYDPY